ncbi:hypothetical protein V8C86DRAFT_2509146 [Haematococcus lacustris]
MRVAKLSGSLRQTCVRLRLRTVASVSTSPHCPGPTSVYVHLPFCKRKCFYCDFPVEAVGARNTSAAQQRITDYVQTLRHEIAAMPVLNSMPLQTIFFGGGTPSLVPPEQLALILADLRTKFGLAPGAEVSMELDPGTFDLAKLQAYKALGLTRVSVGVQSFQQEQLEACGRAHDLADVFAGITAIQSSGIPSWSLDIMSGLPNLSLQAWQQTLDTAVAAQPSHISVYDLQVEPGTPFARKYQPGAAPLPTDTEAAAMFAGATLTLRRAGYEHYEVSNYALPGHRCRHNQVYWAGAPYYAFGLGAASYLEGRRFSRPAAMKAYMQWVQEQQPGGPLPGAHSAPESLEDRMLDTVMLRLRTADGLDLAEFASHYGEQAAELLKRAVEPHVASGRVLLLPDQSQDLSSDVPSKRIRLSDPLGFLVSNSIISDVFVRLSDMTQKL